MALADCAAWMVIVGQIGPVALSVTTSLHIDFLRKPELVDLVAEGTLLKLGKRLARGRGGPVLGSATTTWWPKPKSPTRSPLE